jgi:hypothetical protein
MASGSPNLSPARCVSLAVASLPSWAARVGRTAGRWLALQKPVSSPSPTHGGSARQSSPPPSALPAGSVPVSQASCSGVSPMWGCESHTEWGMELSGHLDLRDALSTSYPAFPGVSSPSWLWGGHECMLGQQMRADRPVLFGSF